MTSGSRFSRHWKYEHGREPLASRGVFARRVAVHFGAGFAIIAFALAVGIAGYAVTEGMDAVDAFLNAAMILGGMGPASELRTTAGKVFAGAYSLFSGVLFLAVMSVMLAPLAHRLLHRLHAEDGPPREE